jgi:hypothetical protein
MLRNWDEFSHSILLLIYFRSFVLSFIKGKNAQAVIFQWWFIKIWKFAQVPLSPSYLHNAHKTFGIVVLIWFRNCFYEKWTIASQFISKMHQMRACILDGTRLDAHQPSADVTTLGYLTIALLVLSWNDPNRKKTLPFDSFMIRSWFWVPYFWKFPKKSRKIAVGEKAPRV